MPIKESLFLAVLGIGVVFVVLAINYLLILLIGLFREKSQTDVAYDASEIQVEAESEGRPTTTAELASERVAKAPTSRTAELAVDFDQELITAIISAVYAYEAELE